MVVATEEVARKMNIVIAQRATTEWFADKLGEDWRLSWYLVKWVLAYQGIVWTEEDSEWSELNKYFRGLEGFCASFNVF